MNEKHKYAQLQFWQDGWKVTFCTSSEVVLHDVTPLQHSTNRRSCGVPEGYTTGSRGLYNRQHMEHKF